MNSIDIISHTEVGLLVEAKDPLGRKVVLKSSTWDEHIKDRHGEQGIEEIKNTINYPNYIIINDKTPESTNERNVYLRLGVNNNKVCTCKTVVEFKPDSEYGEVVTNYILKKINENIIEGGILYDSNSIPNTTRKSHI